VRGNAGAALDASSPACDPEAVTRRFVASLAYALAIAGLGGCTGAPLNLEPLPASPPTCPAGGCGDVARAVRPGSPPEGGCFASGAAACGGAPASECVVRALASWGAANGEGSDGRGLSCVARMLADACSQGESEACAYGGRLWLDGRGVRADSARGLAMLSQGCDAGFVLACSAALRWLGDPSHKTDAEDLGELHTRLESENGCWSGQAELCTQVARSYHVGGDGVARDLPQAMRLYARGCDLGERVACSELGVALTYGEGIARDLERAVALYDRSCRLGFPLGCANLGFMLEHGQGVARDEARAQTLYRESCAAGESYACRHAEMLAAEPRDVPREGDPALRYWQRRCERRDARACAFVSLLYLDGPDGFARDEAKSAEMLSRACELGYARACEWQRELQQDD
jgi:TPR repeat protein